MHEALIYIKKHTKSKKKYSLSGGGGGVISPLGKLFNEYSPPKLRGVKI